MSAPGRRGPIVIDTDVFSADLVPRSPLAQRYAPIITGRPAFISFFLKLGVRGAAPKVGRIAVARAGGPVRDTSRWFTAARS